MSAHAGSAHAGAGAGARIVVVGIGADGWPGLSALAREAILSADEVIGSRRQLELLPGDGPGGRPWPSPIGPLIDELVLRATGSVCVPASGDPMLHGVGATLAGRVPAGRLSVISHPSAFSLACARLGWPAGRRGRAGQRRLATGRRVARILQPGRRALAARSLTSASAALTPNSSPLTAPPRCDRGTAAGAGTTRSAPSSLQTAGRAPIYPPGRRRRCGGTRISKASAAPVSARKPRLCGASAFTIRALPDRTSPMARRCRNIGVVRWLGLI